MLGDFAVILVFFSSRAQERGNLCRFQQGLWRGFPFEHGGQSGPSIFPLAV